MFPSIPFPQAAGMRSGRRMLLDSPRIKALPRCLDSCFSHSASLTALCHDSDELLMPHFFFYCSGKREGEDGGWWGVEVGVRMEADGAPESPPPLHMPLIVSVRCGCCCIDVPLISAHSQTLLAFLRSVNCLVLCLPRRACAVCAGCGWERRHLAYKAGWRGGCFLFHARFADLFQKCLVDVRLGAVWRIRFFRRICWCSGNLRERGVLCVDAARQS